GEGCQHFSPTVQDRYRPASAETEAEGEVTVAFPKRVGCNIGNDDCFLAIHGGAAAACAGADGQAVDGVSIDRREARRREEFHAAAILVEGEDATIHTGKYLLYASDVIIQKIAERHAFAGVDLQHFFLQVKQGSLLFANSHFFKIG